MDDWLPIEKFSKSFLNGSGYIVYALHDSVRGWLIGPQRTRATTHFYVVPYPEIYPDAPL